MSKDIIYREDAINLLWYFQDECCSAVVGDFEKLPSADRPQEWIPCSERLPEEGEIVLVCVRLKTFKYDWEEQRGIEFGRISSDRYDFNGTGWEWLNESGADYWQADYNNSIIAWMPLPEPYSGKG